MISVRLRGTVAALPSVNNTINTIDGEHQDGNARFFVDQLERLVGIETGHENRRSTHRDLRCQVAEQPAGVKQRGENRRDIIPGEPPTDRGVDAVPQDLPVRDDVQGACELLGLDPIYLANEGKLLAFVEQSAAAGVLEVIRKMDYGENSCIIGELVADHPGQVVMETAIGATRLVDMLHGEPLPRIC